MSKVNLQILLSAAPYNTPTNSPAARSVNTTSTAICARVAGP
ncbi:hypothetical protein MCEGE14_00584 [Burkholderiaceae bacterium]